MFSDHRVVEIEACPALIGLPQPQKHFNLNCCYLAWGGSWGGEAMIEVCVCVCVCVCAVAACVSQSPGWRWEYENTCHGDKVRDPSVGSVDNFPLIWILLYKIFVKTGF